MDASIQFIRSTISAGVVPDYKSRMTGKYHSSASSLFMLREQGCMHLVVVGHHDPTKVCAPLAVYN